MLSVQLFLWNTWLVNNKTVKNEIYSIFLFICQLPINPAKMEKQLTENYTG